jgi:hypothetical protein
VEPAYNCTTVLNNSALLSRRLYVFDVTLPFLDAPDHSGEERPPSPRLQLLEFDDDYDLNHVQYCSCRIDFV